MRKDNNQKIFAFNIDGAPLTSQGEKIQNIAQFISAIQISLPDAKFAILTSGPVKTAQDAANKISTSWANLSAFTEKAAIQTQLILDIIALGGSYVFSGLKDVKAGAMAFSNPILDLPLSNYQVLRVFSETQNTSDIMYYRKDGIVYNKQQVQRKGMAAQIIKKALKDKGKDFAINDISIYELNKSIINGEIYTLALFAPLSPREEITQSSETRALKALYGKEAENVFYFDNGVNQFDCINKVGEALNIDRELSKAWTKTLVLKASPSEKITEKKSPHNIRAKIKSMLQNNHKEMGM